MTQKEKKTIPVKLAQELNSRQCADLVKALDEISDLNLLNYVLTDVRRKRQLLIRKSAWLKRRNRPEAAEFTELTSRLERVEKILEAKADQQEKNAAARTICLKFKQRCDEKGIRFDDLCSRSYFSPEDLSMIEHGVYSLLDTLDIEHLIELAGLSLLTELMRE